MSDAEIIPFRRNQQDVPVVDAEGIYETAVARLLKDIGELSIAAGSCAKDLYDFTQHEDPRVREAAAKGVKLMIAAATSDSVRPIR